jgi:hypothetical protein
VSFKSHAHPEEEDPMNEGTEVEEVAEKERDEHFNSIRPMFPTK